MWIRRNCAFCVLAAILIFVAKVRCQFQTIGRPLGLAGLNKAQDLTCQNGDMGPKCASCSAILTCIGSTQLNKQPCGDIDSTKPYCVGNACASSTTETCLSNTFTCTRTGQFPDPSDCSRSYICSGTEAFAYQCPLYYVYESKSGLCKRGILCQPIDCSRTPNQYIVYRADPSILAYCLSTATRKETILFRCPDPQNMQYDQNTLKCYFRCSREGRFADALDCHSYYECYISAGVYQSRLITCPTGYSYSASVQNCIPQATCTNQIEDDSDGSGGGSFF